MARGRFTQMQDRLAHLQSAIGLTICHILHDLTTIFFQKKIKFTLTSKNERL
jgi:ABC-type proline/glycine betaine transport system ATPase subunit